MPGDVSALHQSPVYPRLRSTYPVIGLGGKETFRSFDLDTPQLHGLLSDLAPNLSSCFDDIMVLRQPKVKMPRAGQICVMILESGGKGESFPDGVRRLSFGSDLTDAAIGVWPVMDLSNFDVNHTYSHLKPQR